MIQDTGHKIQDTGYKMLCSFFCIIIKYVVLLYHGLAKFK